MNDPSIRNHGCAFNEKHWYGYLQTCCLDREMGKVLLPSLNNWEVEAFGITPVVEVDHFSLRESGEEASYTNWNKAKSDLNVVVTIDFSELRGHTGGDGVISCKGHSSASEDEPNFFL